MHLLLDPDISILRILAIDDPKISQKLAFWGIGINVLIRAAGWKMENACF